MAIEESCFWHPRQHANPMMNKPPVRISRAEGCYVFDDHNQRYLDGVSGLFNINIGHGRSEVKEAIVNQLNELVYYPILAGFSHPRSEELSALLINMLAPEDMSKVVFGSGGSDAVETALMISRQYWKAQGSLDRTKFISLKRSYHGSNFGSGAISGNTSYRRNYEPVLPGCFHVETPYLYRNSFTDDPDELGRTCADLLEREILFQGPDTVAAFIAEPIQTTGGVIVPSENYWPLVRKVCDKYDVLLIADEVVTGFGRTGSMFGSRGWKVAPDIMCFAKGISSGYVPLGAAVFNRRIEEGLSKNTNSFGAIMHGYTYAGHPLACAAALANLNIVIKEDLAENSAVQGKYLLEKLKPFEERFSAVGEVRGKGLLACIELVKDKKSREAVSPAGGYATALSEAAKDEGLLLRTIDGNKLLLAPPLVIQREEIDILVSALDTAFEKVKPS
ncbi:aminotransferase class III-fold pyridoxal phosphate-dependent enzyme [Methylicorpusculum sp.]|uniref:aminotransferase class III-fold pyridoxal phosphate-dependent enzyme n=1 Tax=Methylicorpusculum sp. TaxID=2713644 RepID=UPI002736ED47|nr:aminotransferase class III-fold pyridoxal phosphate-dependent enzyme [Methylicorpusculum sp.]MDP3530251.1 aminotransferase class III-fold pyridoxal phosphate-dependent enzyme [Methylicorpusculum sp.]MDZ4153091.1 aminotransferase class III-fold pyridoxal phosphate-dependent enzyme [Methylicorpusculum sp.]